MGAHPSLPSNAAGRSGSVSLNTLIASNVNAVLGEDVVARFGSTLPYLLKVIAAETPLSLQVHPHVARAQTGFDEEDAAGVPLGAPQRNFKDRNHKPELIYALSKFEALCGFRAPRRAAEMFAGLDARLAKELHGVLVAQPTVEGIRAAFTQLLEPSTRPSVQEVQEVVEACAARLAAGSTSPRADRTVLLLAEAYPGDPGVVTSLLLNPVTLQPGDAMFVPAGGVHAYLHGLGVEIMASSDNVLRAGLTPKHVDVAELLRNVDYVAAPPIRIAPETFHGATKVFYAPVDDFELSVTEIADQESHPLPGRGPRILLCLRGEMTVTSIRDGALTLHRGEAAFVPASDGPLDVCGVGTLIQADVP
jgi:mannose-6-phosphate isomerase